MAAGVLVRKGVAVIWLEVLGVYLAPTGLMLVFLWFIGGFE